MTFLKIMLAAVLMLAPCPLLFARGWGRAERTLPVSIAMQTVLLMLLGFFLPFSVSLGAVASADGVLLGLGVWRIVKKERLRGICRFVSLPLLAFVLAAPVLYLACCNRLFISYDEFSHWGLVVKTTCAFDALPRSGAGAGIVLYTYPPAGAIWPAVCGTLAGYRDGIAYFGYMLMLWGLAIGLVPEKAKLLEKTIGLALVFLVLMTLFPFTLLRMFSEPMIALLMALIICRDEEQSLALCALCMMLALTKNTGLVFLALALGVRFAAAQGKKLLSHLGMFACGCAAFFAYSLYCRAQGIGTVQPSHLAENLAALMNGTLSGGYASIPQRFAEAFLTRKFPQAGIYSNYAIGTTAAVLFAGLLAVSVLVLAVSPQKKTDARRLCGLWIVNAAYILLTLVSYLFFFPENESAQLSEFDRYLSLPALWTGLVLAGVLLRGAAEKRSGMRLGSLAASAVLLLPLCHPQLIWETLVTRENVVYTEWARYNTAQMAQTIRENVESDSGVPKLLLMGDCEAIALRYELVGDADLGELRGDWGAYAGSAERIAKEIRRENAEYVFVAGQPGDPALAVDERYAALTEDGSPPKFFTLYKVETNEDGDVTLFEVAMAKDIEGI